MRDSSPPEAMRASGGGVAPAGGARGPRLLGAVGELKGRMDARQLTAGGDAGERPRLLPRVGSEEKDDLVEPLAAEIDGLAVHQQWAVAPAAAVQADGEPGAPQSQIAQLVLDLADQLAPPLPPLPGEGEGGVAGLAPGGAR